MKPKRLVHRGTVFAAGFWVNEASLGVEVTRRRILELPSVEEVRRMENGYFVRLRAPIWIACERAPGTPLEVCRGIWLGAPLDADELETLAAPQGSVMLVRGGEAVVLNPESCVLEDLADWIDLSDWKEIAVKPLGRVWVTPRVAPAAKEVDTRKLAGIGELPEEAKVFLAKLKQEGGPNVAKKSPRFATSLLTSIAGALSSIAAWFGGGRGKAPAAGNAATNRALVAVPAQQEPESNWADRLRMALNAAATRLLLWTNLISWIGRRQADYLEKTFSMFDSGDLEEALRHAIPLGSGSDKPKPLALDVPTPRADLSIHTTRGEATSSLGFGSNVFEALRRRYRRAVEQLEKQGKIKEAAFVLAELLGASEEAVSFLEKHGEYQLAAELAEGRNLDPALVVRQWILAGNRARAILIARRTGAFAAAVARLEPSHPEQASMLRVVWANQLADSGAYGAAVQTIWPVEKARNLAREWINLGIEIGGPMGARLLATKAWLVPEEFAAVVPVVRALPRTESDAAVETWTALAQSVLANPPSKTMRILARACLRELLPHATDVKTKSLVERLATATEDPVLLADIRRQPRDESEKKIHVRLAGLTDIGLVRSVNEDAYLIAGIEESRIRTYPRNADEHLVPKRGLLLAVTDGVGGQEGATVAQLALDTLSQHVVNATNDASHMGAALMHAVEEAGIAIYRRSTQDRQLRGAGATMTAAWLHGDTLWIAQVGDTRAYLLRDGRLEQLTKDHSLLNELLAAGNLSPEEVASFEHSSVITRALGTVERIKVDLYRLRILDGDRVMLSTDGVHGVVRHAYITEALRIPPGDAPQRPEYSPMAACEIIKRKVFEAEAPDNMAYVIADFRIPKQSADNRSITAELVPIESEDKPTPTMRIITKTAPDVGATQVHDAVVLPDGRLLVALGEAGVRLISPEGKTLVQFDQPAEWLVFSDHGDRAIAITQRGDAYRTARIDLVRKRAARWFDAALDDFASSFDGSCWFVTTERGIFAVDALEDVFASIWDIKERNCIVGARSADTLSFCIGREAYFLELPTFRMRSRRLLPLDEDTSWTNVGLAANGTLIAWVKNEATQSFAPATRDTSDASWTFLAEGVPEGLFPRVSIDEHGIYGAFGRFGTGHCSVTVFDLHTKKACINVHLEGATMIRARFQHANIVITDDRGRVIVVNVARGKIVAEWRI